MKINKIFGIIYRGGFFVEIHLGKIMYDIGVNTDNRRFVRNKHEKDMFEYYLQKKLPKAKFILALLIPKDII